MASKKMLVPLKVEVEAALAWLEEHSTPHDRDNLVKFAINATKAFGVSMANMKLLAKRLGRNHDLAAALWDTGWYEARALASLIEEGKGDIVNYDAWRSPTIFGYNDRTGPKIARFLR